MDNDFVSGDSLDNNLSLVTKYCGIFMFKTFHGIDIS